MGSVDFSRTRLASDALEVGRPFDVYCGVTHLYRAPATYLVGAPRPSFTEALISEGGTSMAFKSIENEKAYHRAYYLANKEKILGKNKMHHDAPRDERQEYMKEWRAQNGEKMKVHHKNRHARKRGATGRYTPLEWATLKEAYDYKCLRCGRQEPEITLTVDHVVPLVHGGANDVANLQPLCASCNSWKHDRTVDYRSQDRAEADRIASMLASARQRKRRPLSAERKSSISAAMKGRTMTPEWRAKIAASNSEAWKTRGACGETASGERGITWSNQWQRWCVRVTLNGKRVSV